MKTYKKPEEHTSTMINAAAKKRRSIRFSVAQQILLGLALGIATGIFFGEMVGWLNVVGTTFIQFLQITVIPYVSLALITGLGSLTYAQVKALALKGGGILLLLWITCCCCGSSASSWWC